MCVCVTFLSSTALGYGTGVAFTLVLFITAGVSYSHSSFFVFFCSFAHVYTCVCVCIESARGGVMVPEPIEALPHYGNPAREKVWTRGLLLHLDLYIHVRDFPFSSHF